MQANSSDPQQAAWARGPASRWLPRLCEVCQAWDRTPVCARCRVRFALARPRCPQCGLPSPGGAVCGACLGAPPPWSSCVAAVDYGFPWDRLITRFKFGQRPDLAVPLAALLAQALAAAPIGRATVVTAVPLSPARLAERGFNQAWQLARRIARALRLPAHAELLLRCRDTPHQVGLDRAQRERNLRQALLAAPERGATIAGRDIALVDDVMTTGMTARAATLALRDAGAASVQVWVVARTLPDDDR